jgi:hypothetical protein
VNEGEPSPSGSLKRVFVLCAMPIFTTIGVFSAIPDGLKYDVYGNITIVGFLGIIFSLGLVATWYDIMRNS